MNSSKLRSLLLLVLAALAGGGCARASVPLASPAHESVAKSLAPAPGMASIYVVRDGGYVSGTWVLFRVSLDGVERGALADATFFRFSVEPGRHSIIASGN